MKVISAILALACLAMFAYCRFLLLSIETQQDTIAQLQAELIEVSTTKLAAEVLQQLDEKQATRQNARVENIKAAPQSITDKPTPAEVTQFEVISIEQSQQLLEQSKLFAKIEQTPIGTLHANLAANFNNESVNAEWAEQQQQKLTNIWQQNEFLAGQALDEIECRTSQCAFKLSVAVEDVDAVTANIYQSLQSVNAFSSEQALIVQPVDTASGQVTILLTDSRALETAL
ncbi:hypothetical protein ACMZOO_07105 [Catenovulum sp. SX2]|uniref:hypothetical protein n=1 Tax=Catenovulum sp. SX2 TaxID=3398614 RepID=UPI003F87F1E5